jgi:hypothetical protein
MKPMAKSPLGALCLLLLSTACHALAPVPPEIASSHFVVTIDGQSSPVMHAALNLYFLHFPARRHMTVTVTADRDDFWAAGVEVQPWRLNIRPVRNGRSITFTLNGPAKISIARPGDFGSEAEMLYLFANPKEKHVPKADTAGVRYFGPGVHRENIDAVAGDRIYLADGAVVIGSLNIWQVDHVSVSGRGVIVYDGPQNPADDDGWMHKRNWHCIVMDNAHDISIEGITCVVRSRTWQIQMKDSRRIVFDNIKVIGANVGNANADGMDWLGGGDTLVRNSFFRAADDVFSMETSWEGYGAVAFALEGNPVTNITVEDSVLSTSISNIVRAGWPEKNFVGGNFLMRDSDVIHMELWADPHGRGQSAGFHFENVRMEDWYSLVQLRQPAGGVGDVTFTDVMGLEQPSLVPSVLKGAIRGVSFRNTVLAGTTIQATDQIPLEAIDGAEPASFSSDGPRVRIAPIRGLVRPKQKIEFAALPEQGAVQDGLHYTWTFGDGSHANGQKVKHAFPDSGGTLWDGSGRFRVLLDVSNNLGRHTRLYLPVLVARDLRPALPQAAGSPGIAYVYRDDADEAPPRAGVASELSLAAVPHEGAKYHITFEGNVDVPEDGGYTFQLTANEEAAIDIDGTRLNASREPIAQVCGLAGMAAQAISGSTPLAKGIHHLRVEETHTSGADDFRLLWQGPGFSLQPIAPELLRH